MAKAKKRVGKSSKIKKQWFQIVAPKIFNEQVIGEAYLTEIEKGIGRHVPVNMMNLTGDMKRQNINIIFKTTNTTANKLFTEIIGYKIQPSSIKRMVKRGKNKVDHSFSVVTSDGIKVQIKVILVTLRLTNLSYLTSLRNVLKENLTRVIGKTKYEHLVTDLINHRIQSTLKLQLKKIFPLRACEIRDMKVIGKGKPPVQKEQPKVEPKKPEVKVEEKKEPIEAETPKEPSSPVKPEETKEPVKVEEKKEVKNK